MLLHHCGSREALLVAIVEEVERRHSAFERAQERLEYVRHHGIFVGGACVAAAEPRGCAELEVQLGDLAWSLAATAEELPTPEQVPGPLAVELGARGEGKLRRGMCLYIC